VQGTDERFDLILSEPSNPWIAGVANLFTREFYELASRKLAPRGILAQWVQSYAFAPSDYALIVRTLEDVFPHQRLIRISESDTILIASNEPLELDPAALRTAQRLVESSSIIKADLEEFYRTSDVTALFLSRFALDEQGLRRVSAADGSNERNLDRDCRLEFRAARNLYALRDKTLDRFILSAARSEWFLEHYKQLGCDGRHANALHEVIEALIGAGAEDKAAVLLDFGLHDSPDSPALLADQLTLRKPFDFAELERLLALPDRSVVDHANRIGLHFTAAREFDTAVTIFVRLCERFPKSATAWTNLAANYTAQGKREQAEQAERRAGELDPARYFDHPRLMQRQSR
jgi:spermidine synthase